MGDSTEPQRTRLLLIVWCTGENRGGGMLGGGERDRGRAGMGHRETWLCRLCYIVCLLGGPELFVLFAPEALVVVAFALEQLLEVGFAVEFALKSCEGAKAVGGRRKVGIKQTVTSKKKTRAAPDQRFSWSTNGCHVRAINNPLYTPMLKSPILHPQ